MTLVRWRPTDIMGIQNEIDRVFDSFFQGGRYVPTREMVWAPAVDLRENENEFTLVAELPGVQKEDVRISLTDNVLSIRGEKKAEQEVKNENWHQVERSYGKFERHFHLTSPVNAGGIKARYADGILTVTLPKAEEAKPREIKIDF